MSSVVANLFPIMNTPQPPDDDNPFTEMLDIIIIAAVVVSVMTVNPEIGAGAVAATTAAAAATTAVEVGVMAAAIAVTAEVATEELETQLGWRQHFSLRHAAQIAVEAGFGAASFEMGPYLASLNIGEEMLAAGVMSTTEQLGEMALGMQDHFEIENVIAAMMEAAVPVPGPSVTVTKGESVADIKAAQAVAKEIGSLENITVDTVVSGISDHMFEGQPINVLSMAENALGSAVENAEITEFAPQPKQTSTTTLKPTAQQTTMDELDDDIHSLENEIKNFFDPSVVAPNAQKAAPSVARKLSRQGMFAQRNNNDENDGINLQYNPNTGEVSAGSLGKGLDLSDINLDGGVSKAPTTTTATSSAAKIMRFMSALGDTTNLSTAENFLDSVLHPVDSFKGMTLPGVGLNALNAAIMLGTDGWGEVAESIAGEALEGGGAEVSALRSRVLSNIEQSKLSRPAVNNFRIHSLTDDALFKLDATSSVDSAAFWSGDGNEVRATEFAMNANKITLEMTSGGQYLKSFDLFNQYPYKQAIRPWEALSQRFAENASGKVYAFTKGAVPDSVFNRIEYPVLINNPSVTDIMFEPEYKNLLKPKI